MNTFTQTKKTTLFAFALTAVGILMTIFIATQAHAAVISSQMRLGSQSQDVRNLQVFLNGHGFLVASSGAGSAGHETTYFGSLTRAAVIQFQSSQNIAQDGLVGPMTRGHINGYFPVSSDQVSPVLSNLAISNLTSNTATISWNTSEQVAAKVYYATIPLIGYDDPAFANGFSLSGSIVNASSINGGMSHSVFLSGIASHTMHYYRTASIDLAGNATLSSEGTFMTQ